MSYFTIFHHRLLEPKLKHAYAPTHKLWPSMYYFIDILLPSEFSVFQKYANLYKNN